MHVKTLVIIVISLGFVRSCDNHRDCNSCARDTWGWLKQNCRWCALSNTCHAPGSVVNDCDSDQDIKSSSKCYQVAEPPMNYDSRLAGQLAKWSSLAYVPPGSYDRSSIKNTASKYINSNYEIVEFVTADCDRIFNFEHCAAVIAKSSVDKRIIVAFRGTTSPSQIVEQVLKGLTGMTSFRPTGGEILRYNKDTHEKLYPCVKSLVEEILSVNPTWEVMITGHSLGGTLAQLAGANLLSDRVVSQSKLHVYTFGSPRVGDKDFAFGYDRLMGNSWRVTRKNDPIPLIVPTHYLGFSSAYHTRREVYYGINGIMDSNTGYNICKGNEEKDGCTDGEGICILPDCFTETHKNYFVRDLSHFIRNMLTSSGSSPPKGSRANCRSYAIA